MWYYKVMTAANKPLYIEQGATFTFSFNWYYDNVTTPGTPGAPHDLTGCTARMQIRKTQGSDILVNASSSGTLPMIVLGGTSGSITIKFPDTITDNLISDTALYDLEIQQSNGDVFRLLSGKITISPNITQT